MIFAQAKFVVGLHPVFKTKGLKMVGRDHFDPLGPMAVAHDLMEHFDDDDGSPEHELMAIGASWFVRDHGAYLEAKGFPRFGSLVEHLAANLQNVKGELDGLNRTLREFPEDDSIGFVVVTATEASVVGDLIRSVDILPGSRRWLHYGYKRAIRRYAPLTAKRVCEIFASCEQMVTTFLLYNEVGTECEITVADRYQRVWRTVLPPVAPILTPREIDSPQAAPSQHDSRE